MTASKSLPPISVVIPTWNAARFVERALESLWAIDYPHFELLVIDNGVENSDTFDVVERWKPLFHQRSCKLRIEQFKDLLGYAGAVNEGVRQAEYPLVAVTNNDNLPNRLWLKELIAVYNRRDWEGKRIAVVSGFVTRPGHPSTQAGATNIFGRVVYFDTPMNQEVAPVLHPDGSSFLMDRDLLGLPYAKEYFIYHEDVYLGLRTWSEGMACLFAPKARAESFDGGTTKRIAYRTAFYTEKNRILNWLIFFEGKTLFKLAPLFAADLIMSLLLKPQKLARLDAWFKVLSESSWWSAKRREQQQKRKLSERDLLTHISATYIGGQSVPKRMLNAVVKLYCKVLALPLGS